MGGLELHDERELDCLRMHAVPHISKYTAQARHRTLELDAMLEMLEVRLLEILPNSSENGGFSFEHTESALPCQIPSGTNSF